MGSECLAVGRWLGHALGVGEGKGLGNIWPEVCYLHISLRKR